MSKIGVFICHCGDNIAGVVDIEKLKKELEKDPELVVKDHMFLCSEAGQNEILKTLEERKEIDRVVIASCSPKHHWNIFKECIKKKLNAYMWEMANIREQCSWVHSDTPQATKKALALIKGAVENVKHHQPIGSVDIPVNRDVLVIGAGIAGMHASLELADKGFHVYLVEKEPAIGGNMTKLGRTFPTDDCAMCTVSPIMNRVNSHPNIELMTLTEVVELTGRVGDFNAVVQTKPRYVNPKKCTGCGLCVEKCPVSIPNEYNMGLDKTKAIHIPFDSCVPNIAVIDPETCWKITNDKCGVCQKVCPANAIEYDQKPQKRNLKVGAIIVATGYKLIDLHKTEYNYEHPDVITGMELERMIVPTGPTGGNVVCPSDGRIPKTITFLQCVGSRDERYHPYCSNICCLYSIKNAKIVQKKIPNATVNMCYIDIRTPGKLNEEYYKAFRSMGINMIMGRPSEIMETPGGKLYFEVYDKATEKFLKIESDLIVLAAAMEPSEGTKKMAEVLKLQYGINKFLSPLHVKIAPVDTTTEGIYIAGTAEGPKSIQASIVDAAAAASRVATILKERTATVDLTTAYIDPDRCTKCGLCIEACNYNAISTEGEHYKVIDMACKGCGACAAVCPEGAIDIRNLTTDSLRSQVDGILQVEPRSIIAYTTESCGYNAADIAGLNRLEYSPMVKIIKIPCTVRLSVDDIIYPLEKGAMGVMLVACPEGLGHFIGGVKATKQRYTEAKKILQKRGIDTNRLRLIEVLTPDGLKFQKECNDMAEYLKSEIGEA